MARKYVIYQRVVHGAIVSSIYTLVIVCVILLSGCRKEPNDPYVKPNVVPAKVIVLSGEFTRPQRDELTITHDETHYHSREIVSIQGTVPEKPPDQGPRYVVLELYPKQRPKVLASSSIVAIDKEASSFSGEINMPKAAGLYLLSAKLSWNKQYFGRIELIVDPVLK